MTSERDSIGDLLERNSSSIEAARRYVSGTLSTWRKPHLETPAVVSMVLECLQEQHELLVLLEAELNKLKRDRS